MSWLQALALGGALIALAASPLLLARAWRRCHEARLSRLGGWLAAMASMVLFASVVGLARGIALALIGWPVPALVLVWWHRDRRPIRLHPSRPTPPAVPTRWAGRGVWQPVARVLVAVPLALLAVLPCAIQLSYLAGSLTGGVVVALGVIVTLWALAAFWAFADPRLWRPAGGLLLLILISGLPLWLR